MRYRWAILIALVASLTAQVHVDVVSIKPADPNDPRLSGSSFTADAIIYPKMTLARMVADAFNVDHDKISGGPDWVDRVQYTVAIKASAASSHAALRSLAQGVLQDRFGLQFHHLPKRTPVYALVVDKGGSRLQVSTENDEPGIRPLPGGGYQDLHVSMTTFAGQLGYGSLINLDRPVIDQTGLTGYYDVTFKFAQNGFQADLSPAAAESSNPVIFEAIKRQLGLRLDPTTADVDNIVIDRALPPTGN